MPPVGLVAMPSIILAITATFSSKKARSSALIPAGPCVTHAGILKWNLMGLAR
jgi:hypothetical protein